MHHALQIHEILLNIFDYSRLLGQPTAIADLPALARTCRGFKEPALDILWGELEDLSPLARCLPEASYRLSPHVYSFSRPLTQTEWDILQSYSHRIRIVWSLGVRVDDQFATILLDPPTTEPLFPNLRHLCCKYQVEAKHLLYLPFPSLISLSIDSVNPDSFRDSLQSFTTFSPNIRTLSLYPVSSDVEFNKLACNCICGWGNLQTVFFPKIALDMHSLVHLSRMPALTRIDFLLSDTLPSFNAPLAFSDLHHLTLRSKCLKPISWFLSHTQLPVIVIFSLEAVDCSSKQELSTLLASVQTSIVCSIIEDFSILCRSASGSIDIVRSQAPWLSSEDLRPCTVFTNLRCLSIEIEWSVSLKDDELLVLVSSWPHLEELSINSYLGWNTPGGITPNGLLQVLQKCRSLFEIVVAIDTRGYTESPASGLLESAGSTVPCIWVNVLDSVIEAESVQALATFFAWSPSSAVDVSSWVGGMLRPRGWKVYHDRWCEVNRRAQVGR